MVGLSGAATQAAGVVGGHSATLVDAATEATALRLAVRENASGIGGCWRTTVIVCSAPAAFGQATTTPPAATGARGQEQKREENTGKDGRGAASPAAKGAATPPAGGGDAEAAPGGMAPVEAKPVIQEYVLRIVVAPSSERRPAQVLVNDQEVDIPTGAFLIRLLRRTGAMEPTLDWQAAGDRRLIAGDGSPMLDAPGDAEGARPGGGRGGPHGWRSGGEDRRGAGADTDGGRPGGGPEGAGRGGLSPEGEELLPPPPPPLGGEDPAAGGEGRGGRGAGGPAGRMGRGRGGPDDVDPVVAGGLGSVPADTDSDGQPDSAGNRRGRGEGIWFPNVPELTPQSADALMVVIGEFEPERAELLARMQQTNPTEFMRELRQAQFHWWSVVEMREQDRERYDLMLEDQQLTRNTLDLQIRYRQAVEAPQPVATDVEALKTAMRGLVDRHFMVRQALKERELQDLSEELEVLRARLAKRLEMREQIVEQRLIWLLGPTGEF